MEREQFLEQVAALRREDKSIRVIAGELGVPKGRVERALKALFPRAADRSDMASRSASRVFIGRENEMSALTAALDEALSGHCQLVMLLGQPGIGKTRTSQELAFVAEERGAQVLWGRCYEGQGAPPYWPWIQIIRWC